MLNYGVLDYLFIYAIAVIWILMVLNIVLTMSGHRYYLKTLKTDLSKRLQEYPFVSIMVPAHNEAKVIEATVEAIFAFDYPKDRYELIVINDNSTDNSAALLEKIKEKNQDRNFTVINTDKVTGGKGKSNALNIGFAKSVGEYIAIYDADNTPEKAALRHLILAIHEDSSLGAVVGKFRTRNRDVNMLTRFINIETLTFQWMAQAGRWNLFKLCTIPGTNFVMRRSIIEAIGGWDTKAISEDTEISFRIYQMGYRIKFLPQAVTWEQEPQTLKTWFKQRTRWAKGNFYVLLKNFYLVFSHKANSAKFDVVYFLSVYILFLSAIIISDVFFVLGLLGLVHLHVLGSSLLLWALAYVVFILSVAVTLINEKGESDPYNLFLIMIMYFTYCQLWMIVAIRGLYGYITDFIFKKEVKWDKTERF